MKKQLGKEFLNAFCLSSLFFLLQRVTRHTRLICPSNLELTCTAIEQCQPFPLLSPFFFCVLQSTQVCSVEHQRSDAGERVYLTSPTSKLSKINCRGMKYNQFLQNRFYQTRGDEVRRVRYQHNQGGFREMVQSGLPAYRIERFG